MAMDIILGPSSKVYNIKLEVGHSGVFLQVVLTQNWPTCTQALECAGSQRSQPDEVPWRPVRPVAPTGQTGWAQRALRRPRTSSSGGTKSELEDLGLSWNRLATQDALERRRDE